jgi:wobble nucleotide-excising tRNase
MLESISLRNVATYDDAGIQISNLKKVNFIYGANGSGKTTLTKLIDKPSEVPFAHSSLKWKNEFPIRTLVYNKDFKDRNFGKGKIDGVFTLGQATKDEIDAIEIMRVDLQEKNDKIAETQNSLENQKVLKQQLTEEFRESVWQNVYKKYENDFKEAFVGVMKKEGFRGKLIQEFESNDATLKVYEELKEKAHIIFGEIPTKMPLIKSINYHSISEIETHLVWQKKIIGKADVQISTLIQKLNLNDWVNEGRSFLHGGSTCPFCQQETITDAFKKQLEDYFDETFTTDIKLVQDNSSEYTRLTQNLQGVLQEIETVEKSNGNSKLDLEKFSAYLKILSSQIASNKEVLTSKIKEPSRSISLVLIRPQLDDIVNLIDKTNKEIEDHNNIVTNYAAERNILIRNIWKFLVEEYRPDIESFNPKINGIEKGIAALEKKLIESKQRYHELNAKIKEANKNVTSVQPSVDEINRILQLYGFLNFKIVPSRTEANQYQILRDDETTAESTLSEGEITFITFLYFMQLAKGSTSQELITEERILVIDDPISSLDSNVLFVVSSLLKEVIKSIKNDSGNIKQLILLTHNIYFHKEVSFIDGRTKSNNDTFFWILRRNSNVSSIQSFEMSNPIQNSYELLWQEIKNRDYISGITIQNTMRRIIESYFKILGKFGDDDLIKKFANAQEQEICRSLISWINDGSHSIPDDLFIEHQGATIDKYFEVFKRIFDVMGHAEHYNMMMRAVA